MSKAVYKYLAFVFCSFVMSAASYAQVDVNEPVQDKVIISGKTYYLHLVKKGEGFYGIAKKYGVSQKEIHDANSKAIFGLKPGDILKIPVISGRNSSKDEIQESGEFVYHTIEKGQTLYFLSRKYQVSLEDIKKYNIGADQKLLVGTIFKIPVYKRGNNQQIGEGGYLYHVVEPKETLYAISKHYNVEIVEIVKCNPALQSGILKVGSKIRIPEKELEATTAAETNLGKMEDKRFIYHKIQAGDTFFSLTKKYHLQKEALNNANPDLNPEDLEIGYLVRIPKKNIKIEKDDCEEDFIVHMVKRKETVYSIAKKYKVAVEDIEESNPTVILSNIRKGKKLKVPTLQYLANKKQMLEEKKAELVKNVEHTYLDSIYVDCGDYNYHLAKESIRVALLLPFDIEATKKANIITKMINDEEVEMKREDPIVSTRSRSFVEFYEGVLIAVDSMKRQGVNIQLYTYDTAPDTNKVKAILELPELKTVDFIIGPAYTSNLSLVSDYSYRNGIKMIYPLSNKNPEIDKNPFLFQVNTPDSLLIDNYANYIVNKHDGSRLLILKSAQPDSYEEKFCKAIKDKLFLKYIPQGKVPDLLEISFSERNVQGIEALLNKEGENRVVIPSQHEADVSKIIATLHGVVESTDIKVQLIGFGNWLRYQTIDAEEIHDLNTEILTSYVVDYKDSNTNNFIQKYRDWYHTEPFAVAPLFIRPGRNEKFSKYGAWGFDVAYYFIDARVKYGRQFEYCISNCKSNQVQFNFNFDRGENWGGFYNNGLSVINFLPSLDINCTKIY